MSAMGRKVEIISFVFRFYGSLTALSYSLFRGYKVLFIIPDFPTPIFIVHFLLNPVIVSQFPANT